MRPTALILALTAAVCTVFAACAGKQGSSPAPGASALQTEAVGDNESPTASIIPTLQLPELMKTGPLDPIPAVDDDGNETEHLLLAMANLGHYASLEQLRKSPFYVQLCDQYPQLSSIKSILDTGKGDLWLIVPREKNMSLAINEYTMEMFLGKQKESDGQVLFRTEDAKPMLLRMSADDPGSVQIHAVDNSGHTLAWIPAQRPQDNGLRQEPGVANITYNPVDNAAEFGSDYQADAEDNPLTVRFYADRQLYVGEHQARYVAFHQEDGQIGLYIYGKGIESYAVIEGFAPDVQFSLTFIEGNDFGLGKDKPVVFKNLSYEN